MTEYLDIEDLLALADDMGVGPVRDHGLLESAVARARAAAFGEDAYPMLASKAAALFHSACKDHGLVDGNKRLAWLSTVVFLHLNGYVVTLSDDDAFELVMRVADGTDEIPEIVAVLEPSLKSVSP